MIIFLINWNNNLEEKEKAKKKDLFKLPIQIWEPLWNQVFSGIKSKFIEAKKNSRISLHFLQICFPYYKDLFNPYVMKFPQIISTFINEKVINILFGSKFQFFERMKIMLTELF